MRITIEDAIKGDSFKALMVPESGEVGAVVVHFDSYTVQLGMVFLHLGNEQVCGFTYVVNFLCALEKSGFNIQDRGVKA